MVRQDAGACVKMMDPPSKALLFTTKRFSVFL